MKQDRCIWCLNLAGGKHVEHIIPESLGCPENFILPSNVICKSCNNGMGHLDQAVSDDFDFLTFQAGIPRKNGKSPKIASRGNVFANHGDSGPFYIFNMGPGTIKAPSGEDVAPYKGQPRNINASIKTTENEATVSFDFLIGQSRKFQRGIYKIAMSGLAHYVGASEIYKQKYNIIRQYVRNGNGNRHFISVRDIDYNNYYNEFNRPWISTEGDYIVTFRLAVMRFVVDLSENENELPKMIENFYTHYGKSGWTVLPVK